MSKNILVQKSLFKRDYPRILFFRFLFKKNFLVRIIFGSEQFRLKNLIKKNLVKRKYSPQNCWLDYIGYFS